MNKLLEKLERNPESVVKRNFFMLILGVVFFSMISMLIVGVKVYLMYITAILLAVIVCDYVINKKKKVLKISSDQRILFLKKEKLFDQILDDAWKKIDPEYNTGNPVYALAAKGVDFVLTLRIHHILEKFT